MYPGRDDGRNNAPDPIPGDERWQAVQHVLDSSAFAKAPRMCALLAFLMTRKLNGMEASLTEFTIGVEVFRRVARDFDTTIDPVVRVQMGRLRERLARYDALQENESGPRIVIPPGSYVPQLTTARAPQPAAARPIRLAPLRTLTPDAAATVFVSGLEEELSLQLFRRLGGRGMHDGTQDDRVEVSVRIERGHVRASVRLVEGVTGRTAWLQQCDVHGELGIGLQEELALAICDDLQRHVTATANASRFAGHAGPVPQSTWLSGAGGRCFPADRS